MQRKLRTLALVSPGAVLLMVQAVSAQSSPPPATATRRTDTTGQTNADPKVKEMNQDAKRKIEREGK